MVKGTATGSRREQKRAGRGYLAGVVALVTCPCHYPLTLGILAGALGGSALGTFLTANAVWFAAAAAAVFVAALYVAVRYLWRST